MSLKKKIFGLVMMLLMVTMTGNLKVMAAPVGYYEKYGDSVTAEREYGEDLILLARMVYAEAGNQPFEGKCAVADTVLNRVDDERFPNTIEGVIYSPYQYYTAGLYGLENVVNTNMQECFEAVTREVHERSNNDILYFQAGSYHGFATPAFSIGDHYFSY